MERESAKAPIRLCYIPDWHTLYLIRKSEAGQSTTILPARGMSPIPFGQSSGL